LIHVLIAFTLLAGAAAGRLFWLQIVRPAVPYGSARYDIAAASVLRRALTLPADSGRGLITDRRGIVLAGREATGLLLLPGWADRAGEERIAALAEALNVPLSQLLDGWRTAERPVWWSPEGVGETPWPLSEE